MSMQDEKCDKVTNKIVDHSMDRPLPKPFSNQRRRSSLEVDRLSTTEEECGCRRASIGEISLSQRINRRSSLGEDLLRLNFTRKNFTSSATSLVDQTRRLSLDSDHFQFDPRRRSSLGAESLIEYDLEDDREEGDKGNDLPPEALLGLQYVDDVFVVKRNLEKQLHPYRCLATQPQVTEPMRCTLVNWLVKVNRQLQFGPETVFQAVHLLDRFLSTSAIASDCAQLLAVCALFVAAKMEERNVPRISTLAVLCSSAYQRHHFRRMEILLLTKLGFSLHAPSSWYFINYLSLKACQLGYLDRTVCRAARRSAEACLSHYEISQFIPSIQAAAALIHSTSVSHSEEPYRIIEALLRINDNYQENPEELPDAVDRCRQNHNEETGAAGCAGPLLLSNEDWSEYYGLCSSNLSQGCLNDFSLCHYESIPTSPALVMELVNVMKILFTTQECFEIVECSRMMTSYLASFDDCNSPDRVKVSSSDETKKNNVSIPANTAPTLPTVTYSTSVNAVISSDRQGTTFLTNSKALSRNHSSLSNICTSNIDTDISSAVEDGHCVTAECNDVYDINLERRDSGISTLDGSSSLPIFAWNVHISSPRRK